MPFIDYYEVMQISPNAQPETIHRVFKILAGRYHPDNPQTGDLDRFLQLQQAHKTLSDPEKRAEFDGLYQSQKQRPLEIFASQEFSDGWEAENNRRMGVLSLLYNRRRVNPDEAGMSILDLETLMSIPREHLMFTLWYLRQKGHIQFNEDSDYEITGDGADHVEAQIPKQELMQKLLQAPASDKLKSAASVLAGMRESAPRDRQNPPRQ